MAMNSHVFLIFSHRRRSQMPKKTTKKDTLEKPINRKLEADVALISKNYAG